MSLHLAFGADVTPDIFLKRIGKGCEGLTDKFPGGLEEILGSGRWKLKKMGVPVKQVSHQLATDASGLTSLGQHVARSQGSYPF